MIRPGLHHQGIPQTFLPQQHGQSAPSQPHNLNILPPANQSMSFLQNPHSSNGPFPNPHPHLARIQADSRRRDIHSQSQRATAGGAQTPSVVNGVLSGQPSGVGYSGVPQNVQVPAHRVVSQPVGAPLTPSHPTSHPGSISNPGLGLNGGLQTQRSVSQSQPQPQMGPRPGQPSLPGQPSISQIRQPPVGLPGAPSGTGVRGSAGMAVNMAPGMLGNVPQQTPQQGFSSPLGMGGAGPQPPPQGPQGPTTSISQPMHRTISTPEGANSFGGMPGFAGGPFSQAGPHPPASHITGHSSANQFSFMPPSSSPSQHMDMHGLPSGSAGPSSTSPTRSDFTMTPAQVASLQYGPGGLPGNSGSGTNETFHSTFTTIPPPQSQQPPQRPSSSSLGLASQQAPTAQGLSHPTPPRQQTPLQQSQLSQPHLSERLNAPIPNPTRPQSQPQRPPSQQQARQSSTPRMPPGTLPPNATLLQGHRPASITGASAPPPQPRSAVTGPPPMTSTPSTENGDMSRQPGVPGIRASMPSHSPAIGFGQALTRVLQFSAVLAAEDQKPQKLQLTHWEKMVEEFFTSSATLKLTLWKDNQKVEAKVFEVGTPVLPRFFLVTSQSGVKSMTLSLDGARERVVGPNQAVVQCVSAMWTYRYRNGYTVTLRGPFAAHVVVTPNATQNGASAQSVPPTAFILKIDHISFDSNLYEKHVAVDVIGGNRLDAANKTPQVRNAPTPSPTINGAAVLPVPAPQPQPPQQPPRQVSQRDDERWEEPRITYERATIPAEPVNAFGIPQATMRCLELAESVAQMADLMSFSRVHNVGPLDTLKQFVQRIREMPMHPQVPFIPEGMSAGPSTHSLYTPTMSSTAPSSAQIPPATIPQSAPSTSSPASSPDKAKGTPQQANAPNPTAPPPAGSSTPSMASATLKRKGGGGDTASPTTANAEQSSSTAKRNPRKRGRTTGGN